MFPESINFFGIHFYLFGIIAGLSLLLGYSLTVLEMGRLKISTKIAPDMAFDTLVPAFLGARLLFVALNWNYYSAAPLNIFKVWDGGIVLYGGILGGLLGGFIFSRKKKISFLKFSDPIAFGLAFGLALSRLGCLAAGCCYGTVTDLPWGITFNNGLSLATPLHEPLHPTQIYSFLMGMIIFAILLILRKRKTFEGELLLVYLFLSSGARVLIEGPLRADSSPTAGLITLAVFIVSGVLYSYLKYRSACMKPSTMIPTYDL